MKIGFDLDGVLADFNTAFFRTLARNSKRYLLDATDETPYFMPAVWAWPEALGYTQGEIDAAWVDAHMSDQFWRGLAPYPDTRYALDMLFILESQGHDVYFITNRTGAFAKRQTEQWLKHCGFLARPTVLLSAEKALCVVGLGLDYYIDDNLTNAVDVAEMSSAKVYLLNRPWNQCGALSRVTRVDSPLVLLQDVIGALASHEGIVIQTLSAR